jgi:hypothetical protein
MSLVKSYGFVETRVELFPWFGFFFLLPASLQVVGVGEKDEPSLVTYVPAQGSIFHRWRM